MQGHRKVQTTGRELPGTTVTRRSPASPLPLLLSSSPTIPCVPGQPCGGRCDPIPGDRHTDPDTTHTTAHYFSLHPVDGVSHRSSSAQPATLNLCVNIINAQRQHNTFFFFLTLRNHTETRQECFSESFSTFGESVHSGRACCCFDCYRVSESSLPAPRTIEENQLHLKGNHSTEWEMEPKYPVF